MANKTQLGIGAVIVALIAAYLGVDFNQSNNHPIPSAEHQQQTHSQENSPKNTQQHAENKIDDSENNQNIGANSSSQNKHGLQVIQKAYQSKLSNVQVQSEGRVKAILRDDNEGSRHQKFILSLENGLTILVAHNIDLSPRIENLRKGDTVEFFGEYEYSQQGGVVHWTHHDPQGRHEDGWLKHGGKTYQ